MRDAALAVVMAVAAVSPATAQPTTMPGNVVEYMESTRQALEAVRDDLRERGIPLTPADLDARRPDVPADADAAIEVQRALDAYAAIGQVEAMRPFEVANSHEMPRLPGEGPPRFEPEQVAGTWDELRAALAAYEPVFAALDGIDPKIRPTVDEVQADFGVVYDLAHDPFMVDAIMPSLSGTRSVAILLNFRLLADVEAGRHGEAVEAARHALGLADAIDVGRPSIVGHLVNIGIEALTGERLRRVAPLLDIGDGDGQASPEAVRGLIDVLLDQDEHRRAWRRAIESEIVLQQNAVDVVLAGPSDEALEQLGSMIYTDGNVFVKSLVRLQASADGTRMAELTPLLLDAAEAERRAEAMRAIQPYVEGVDALSGDVFRHPLAGGLMGSLDRFLESHYRGRADRNLTAVALAVRLYQADHDGELPPTLDALAPDYLPAVPTDVLAPEGELQYDRDRGVVWSVGWDGEDDGGVSMDDRFREIPGASMREIEQAGFDSVVRLRPDDAME